MAGESDQYFTYSSGTTMTVNDGVTKVYVDPGSLVASLTATAPPNPSDQQRLRFVFGGTINTGTVVTLFTFAPNSGQTLIGVTTGLFTGGISMLWEYKTLISKWIRLQ